MVRNLGAIKVMHLLKECLDWHDTYCRHAMYDVLNKENSDAHVFNLYNQDYNQETSFMWPV